MRENLANSTSNITAKKYQTKCKNGANSIHSLHLHTNQWKIELSRCKNYLVHRHTKWIYFIPVDGRKFIMAFNSQHHLLIRANYSIPADAVMASVTRVHYANEFPLGESWILKYLSSLFGTVVRLIGCTLKAFRIVRCAPLLMLK